MTVKEGTSNIGKKPIVKAEAYVVLGGEEVVLATAYIKVEVVPEAVVPDEPLAPITLNVNFGAIEYGKLPAKEIITIDDFNKMVVDPLKLTQEGVLKAYGNFKAETVSEDGDAKEDGLNVNCDYASNNMGGTAFTFTLDNSVEYNDAKEVIFVYSPASDEYPAIHIHVKYNVTHDLDACWPAFDEKYFNADGAVEVKGVMDETEGWVLSTVLSEHFADATEAEDIVFDLPKLDDEGNVDDRYGMEQSGVELIGSDVNATLKSVDALSGDKTVIVRMTRTHDNGMSHSKLYKVVFKVPFKADAPTPIVLTDSREAVSADLTKSLTIREAYGSGNAIYEAGKVNDKNTYGFDADSFVITSAFANTAEITVDATNNTITWKNEGTLLQKPVTVEVAVTVTIDKIYTETIKVPVTINPAE